MVRSGRVFAAVALAAFSCRSTNPSNQPSAVMDGPVTAAAPGALSFIEWDVRFTNPTCESYPYAEADVVAAVNGERLLAKPKDTFCTKQKDFVPSAERLVSPQYKLLEWINDPATKEIFFAYLSISNQDVKNALCKASERGVKITFVMDSTQDATIRTALEACGPAGGDLTTHPKGILRGNNGEIGYAHNKVFLINPGQSPMKLAFSSGNMTSGIVLHHENWNFVTLEPKTYFAQAHLCLMNAQLNDQAVVNPTVYFQFIKDCRQKITQELGLQEENDVKVFFTPGEGARARDTLAAGIRKANKVYVAAHRFSYDGLINALYQARTRPSPAEVSIVTDDDTYWVGTTGEQVGDNLAGEYYNIRRLTQRGAKVRWMETNHGQHLLHHNKYVVMNKNDGTWGAVFGGAGNFTGTAFGTSSGGEYKPNFENFYYIEVPSVLKRYNEQFPHMWNDLATPPERMPKKNILPPGSN